MEHFLLTIPEVWVRPTIILSEMLLATEILIDSLQFKIVKFDSELVKSLQKF